MAEQPAMLSITMPVKAARMLDGVGMWPECRRKVCRLERDKWLLDVGKDFEAAGLDPDRVRRYARMRLLLTENASAFLRLSHSSRGVGSIEDGESQA